jgi:hypothetical protein
MISNAAYNAIQALDFSQIKLKLTHEKFGEGWSPSRAEAMETEYRRFLYLQFAFPGEQTAPTKDVDTFWHYHILDTVKYAADCEQVFGYFLHHYPYLGLMDEDEADVDIDAGNRTRALYESTFGEAYLRPEAYGVATAGDGNMAATPQTAGHANARCQALCIVARPVASEIFRANPQKAGMKQRKALRPDDQGAACAARGPLRQAQLTASSLSSRRSA